MRPPSKRQSGWNPHRKVRGTSTPFSHCTIHPSLILTASSGPSAGGRALPRGAAAQRLADPPRGKRAFDLFNESAFKGIAFQDVLGCPLNVCMCGWYLLAFVVNRRVKGLLCCFKTGALLWKFIGTKNMKETGAGACLGSSCCVGLVWFGLVWFGWLVGWLVSWLLRWFVDVRWFVLAGYGGRGHQSRRRWLVVSV